MARKSIASGNGAAETESAAQNSELENSAAQNNDAQSSEVPPKFDVKIHSLHFDGALRANASVNINGEFAVRGIKVMEGTNGIFVSMPSYKSSTGEYKDICFPCTKEARAEFDKAILSAYESRLEMAQSSVQAGSAVQMPKMA